MKIFEGLISGLIVAFILSFFSVDKMVVEVLKSFTSSINWTVSHYYIIMGLIGFAGGLIFKLTRSEISEDN